VQANVASATVPGLKKLNCGVGKRVLRYVADDLKRTEYVVKDEFVPLWR
jgi:hypothetical protein